MSEQVDRLRDVVAPVLGALGLTCYDVEVTGSGRGRTLRVLVDRDGGVDLDSVTAATRALGPALDEDPSVAAALGATYLLEVSSPGLERPLRTPDHFRRARGATVSLKCRGADGALTRRRAVVLGADDGGIDVEVDGGCERVAYTDVLQARTVFEWGPAAEPQPAKGSRKPGVRTAARGGTSARGGPSERAADGDATR